MPKSRSASTSARRCRRGLATIEFALVGATLLIVIFATIDLSRFMATRTSLRAAVSDLSRIALVNRALTSADAKTTAMARAPLLQSARLSMTVTHNPTAATPSVQVAATYTFDFVIPVFGAARRTLRADVTTPY